MAPPSLDTLPVEILSSIFRLLDPIGLISASQTSSQFRRIIKPNRPNFVERLLALESREKEGGPALHFRPRGNQLTPDWGSKEWEAMRWVCAGCLRLLPHIEFDNHSLLRLGYRKPIPNSRAANFATSWESTAHHNSRKARRQLKKASAYKEEARLLHQRYGVATMRNGPRSRWDLHPVRRAERLEEFHDCGMTSFQDITIWDYYDVTEKEEEALLDSEAFAVELVRCGFKRHLRRCNECKYQRNQIRRPRPDGYGGTARFPIVPSRTISYPTLTDRYFPGFWELLETERPASNPPVFLVYREEARDRPWTMYQARCPRCERWKEIRQFRIGELYPHWQPTQGYSNWDRTPFTKSFFDNAHCNSCFVQANGREELGKALMEWLRCIINVDLGLTGNYLQRGFGLFTHRVGSAPYQYRTEIRQLLVDLQPILDDAHDRLHRGTVAFLRLRFTHLMNVRERAIQEGRTKWLSENPWELLWRTNYDELEAQWLWLKGFQEELEMKREFLVDWALQDS
ncbi:hypothetical protein NUU61_007410 [Penicillium alfredii]|uniref:F-box domain-containing protein n=1 Tax=Penicillium alfredii TaxID=1506179 RepID=A0A9W9F2Q7_9EURO|nr:uncharacterized protein NUU61_007410 [Penicillium alfredii]KAJ5092540.1 hypothetical protein NUU61_007410 [Penicillium alfredii]